jgi:hypothetical protein
MKQNVSLQLQPRLLQHPLRSLSSAEFRSLQEPSMIFKQSVARSSLIWRELRSSTETSWTRSLRRFVERSHQASCDINKLLESATGSAIIQPIQLLQDLYIELNNSLAETESNEIFYIIDWDATGAITHSTNMITHHVPNLTAQ